MTTKKSCCQESQVEREERVLSPATDLSESDAGFELRMDLPGADPTSIDVQFEDGVLSVVARASMPKHEGARVILDELQLGRYERRFRVAAEVDVEGIEASYRLGVLHLRVPKAQAEKRQVEVRLS